MQYRSRVRPTAALHGIAISEEMNGLEQARATPMYGLMNRHPVMPYLGMASILAALALMPVGEAAFNIVIAAMGVFGVITLIQTPQIARDSRVRLVFALLACLMVPMAISLIGAVEPGRSLRTTAAFLRFPFAAVFVIVVLSHPVARRWMPLGTLVVLGVWTIDGIIQWRAGANIFGQPYDGVNLTGMFHPKRVIGLLIAPLFPVMLETAWREWQRHRAIGATCWVVVAMMPLVVLLGGSRTSWMMLGIAIACWAAYRYLLSSWRYKTIALIAGMVAIVAMVPLVPKLPGMESRIEQTKRLLSDDYHELYEATSGRLIVWRIAAEIARDHWLIGVGPRGYRFAYPEYDEDNRQWITVDPETGLETGMTHPHLTALEVMVETGAVGLVGFAIFWVLLARAVFKRGNEDAWPWAMTVLIAFFPLNMHMAIYATYWSHYCWWLVMIMAAMLASGGAASADPLREGNSPAS
jgi:putative inorganic carbon (hco3(-)) transporter